MMACRTRHCLSSASSMMAGKSACERRSIPMTGHKESARKPSKIESGLTVINRLELADKV